MNRRKVSGVTGTVLKTVLAASLAWAVMGVGCDHDAATVFRQTATAPIGDGVKTFLAGDHVGGVGQIVSAGIDGVVASIEQAGTEPVKK